MPGIIIHVLVMMLIRICRLSKNHGSYSNADGSLSYSSGKLLFHSNKADVGEGESQVVLLDAAVRALRVEAFVPVTDGFGHPFTVVVVIPPLLHLLETEPQATINQLHMPIRLS